MIDAQDLRAAVQRGLITETQAAGLIGLAEARRQAVARVEPGEEPFVLFKGFNEIFIVIGLSILFMGWTGIATILGAEIFSPRGLDTVLVAAVTLGGLAAAQRYFTLTRRMIAPSIALAIMSALTAWVLGLALADLTGLQALSASALSWAAIAGIM